MSTRRAFLEAMAAGAGAVVLLPAVTSCKEDKETADPKQPEKTSEEPKRDKPTEPTKPSKPPTSQPADWDPIAYNRERGNAGTIPKSYRDEINGPDGEKKHLGKHLPYQIVGDASAKIPEGYIALMWGDPDKGYARHPNAVRGPDNNNEGHWYNWIRIRKAADADVEELKSEYSQWPEIGEGDNGKYVALGGGDLTADSGKNTIYLAALPKDIKPGDTIRIWAHCLTHGEYVDFLTVQ